MVDFKKAFYDARKFLTKLMHPKIKSLTDLKGIQTLDNQDLSELDIPAEYFDGSIPFQYGFKGFTENVIWSPHTITTNNPQQLLEKTKQTGTIGTTHKQGSTGNNIGIAIIDQRLFTEHPEYADRIKHYECVGPWPANDTTTPDYHGSLVAGCAVGKTTGTAPDADLYYFAANGWPIKTDSNQDSELQMGHRQFKNMAIRRILEINKTLPEHKKIRFLSCSWGGENDQFRSETETLFDECERNGIMVLGGFYKHTLTSINNYDHRNGNKKITIGIPTDGKTSPFFKGGYRFALDGGSSSTFPYLAGVFACALQGNTIFCTRENWQDELIEIMKQTASEHPMGGKIINPTGIVERVSQIARTMEMDLIKHQASQHE